MYIKSVFTYPFFNQHLLWVYYNKWFKALWLKSKISFIDLENLTFLKEKTSDKSSFTMNYLIRT